MILIACFGNVLRGDDGFGVAVAERLLAGGVPDGVRIIDVGIGGIHLVQELLDPVDALLIVDAVNLGRVPGTVVVVLSEEAHAGTDTSAIGRDQLADMHYATPERALMLGRGLGVVPAATFVVGCECGDADRLGEGLSPAVAAAVEIAAVEVKQLVRALGVRWI